MAGKVELAQRLVDTRKTGTQHGFHRMQVTGIAVFLFLLVAVGTGIGQQFVGEREQVNNAGQRDENPDPSKLEHRKPFISGFEDHTVHNEVGRCPDQGTDTA